MVEEKVFFVWPLIADVSEEHVTVLKSIVSLEFVPEVSSQRKQFYRVV